MLQLELPAETRSVSLARHRVHEYCVGDDCAAASSRGGTAVPDVDLLQVVALLTTELVANAVRHGGGDRVRVTVDCSVGGVRVTCSDDNPAEPVVRHVDPDSTSGRGMALVDVLADSWGSVRAVTGKQVWFQVGGDA